MSISKKIDKKIFLTFSVLIVFALFIFYYFLNQSLQNNQNIKKTVKQEKVKDVYKIEEENIKKANQKAIAEAQNEAFDGEQVKAIDENDFYIGDLKAPVQIIVYSDLDDKLSADYDAVLEEVRNYFGDKVVMAFRFYPKKRSELSWNYAMANECAGEQGKFFEAREFILNQQKENKFFDDILSSLPDELKIDKNKFQKCFEDEKYKKVIEEQIKQGDDLVILGTPSTFVNNEFLPGAYHFEDFVDSSGANRRGLKTIIESKLNPVKM